jgi:hypothetical protein
MRLVDLQQRDAMLARTEPERREPRQSGRSSTDPVSPAHPVRPPGDSSTDPVRPPGDSSTDPVSPVRPPTSEQAAALITTVVRALLEVLEGRRPPRQLAPMLEPGVLDQLETLVSLGARRMGNNGLRLYKVRVCLPHASAIEGCAVVRAGHRFRALAIRLEYGSPRWKCTALRLG